MTVPAAEMSDRCVPGSLNPKGWRALAPYTTGDDRRASALIERPAHGVIYESMEIVDSESNNACHVLAAYVEAALLVTVSRYELN
jgi:hypothetical protein